MIILLVTATYCGACKKFKNSTNRLPSDTEWNKRRDKETANIGKFSYNFKSFFEALQGGNTIVLVDYEISGDQSRRELVVKEISIFNASNIDDENYTSRGMYYIKQSSYENVDGKPVYTPRYITPTAEISGTSKTLSIPWGDFVARTIPAPQIKEGLVAFPTLAVFDNALWEESIRNPQVPLYRRYYGQETNDAPPYKPIVATDANGRISFDHSKDFFAFIEDLKSNSGLIPSTLRVKEETSSSSVKVEEVSLSEFVPYIRRRR